MYLLTQCIHFAFPLIICELELLLLSNSSYILVSCCEQVFQKDNFRIMICKEWCFKNRTKGSSKNKTLKE